jgi:hypothetical protein
MTQKNYAYVNQQGFVVFEYSGNTPTEFENLTIVEIDFEIGNAPTEYSQFQLSTKTWVDTRTDQQKYDDAASAVIQQRNDLLYQSDWTQIPNNPLSPAQQDQWAAYRQQLRDVTSQSGYPFNVVWPTKPE